MNHRRAQDCHVRQNLSYRKPSVISKLKKLQWIHSGCLRLARGRCADAGTGASTVLHVLDGTTLTWCPLSPWLTHHGQRFKRPPCGRRTQSSGRCSKSAATDGAEGRTVFVKCLSASPLSSLASTKTVDLSSTYRPNLQHCTREKKKRGEVRWETTFSRSLDSRRLLVVR